MFKNKGIGKLLITLIISSHAIFMSQWKSHAYNPKYYFSPVIASMKKSKYFKMFKNKGIWKLLITLIISSHAIFMIKWKSHAYNVKYYFSPVILYYYKYYFYHLHLW